MLHVTEAFGGGVQVAVNQYVSSTPEFDHVILAAVRRGHEVGERIEMARYLEMNGGLLSQVRDFRENLRSIRPDIVHVHSAMAGGYVRLVGSSGVPLVYTPHCFAFERLDVPAMLRRSYRLAERLLATRSSVMVVGSEHEARLAGSIGFKGPLVRVPTAPERSSIRAKDENSGVLKVCTLGRVSPQKDPAWFSEVVDAHSAAVGLGQVEWTWIGGGRPEDEMALRQGGVRVTGWLPRHQAVAELAQNSVYLHTAAWEAGTPYAILEAAAAGLPVVSRWIPSLDLALPMLLARDPTSAARAVMRARETPDDWKSAREVRLAQLRIEQRLGLLGAYQAAQTLGR